MSATLVAALRKLLQTVSGELAASSLTAAQRKAIELFGRQTGCILLHTKGRGMCYRVQNAELLQQHFRSLCPDDIDSASSELPLRAAAIATSRDSKALTGRHQGCYLLLKAIGPGISWRNDAGQVLDVSAATDRYGVAALAVASDDTWHSDQALWLVENQALFDRLDWLPANSSGTLCCYGGQLNLRLLDWLAGCQRASEIILFADYDGVGLHNFARLHQSLQGRCQFWLIPGWQQLLQRYGNARIWGDTLKDFRAATGRLALSELPPPLVELVETLASQGLALEQEAVWLAPEQGIGS